MSRTPEANRLRRKAEIAAGKKIEHTQKIKESSTIDTCICSCGWESNSYWDGAEYAYNEWVEHIKKNGAIINYPEE